MKQLINCLAANTIPTIGGKLRMFGIHSYHKEGIVPIGRDIMSTVIRDTSRYSIFIPWCIKSRVVRQISDYQNETELIIKFNRFTQLAYTSKVKVEQKYECYNSPLRMLTSSWRVAQILPSHCRVQYNLQYEFENILYNLTSNMLLDYLGLKLWNVFVQQAIAQQTQHFNKQTNKILQRVHIQQINGQTNQHIQQTSQIQTIQQIEQKQRDKPTQMAKTISNDLQAYLEDHPAAKALYNNNSDFQSKLNRVHQRLKGTSNYKKKLSHEIQTLLVYYN